MDKDLGPPFAPKHSACLTPSPPGESPTLLPLSALALSSLSTPAPADSVSSCKALFPRWGPHFPYLYTGSIRLPASGGWCALEWNPGRHMLFELLGGCMELRTSSSGFLGSSYFPQEAHFYYWDSVHLFSQSLDWCPLEFKRERALQPEAVLEPPVKKGLGLSALPPLQSKGQVLLKQMASTHRAGYPQTLTHIS